MKKVLRKKWSGPLGSILVHLVLVLLLFRLINRPQVLEEEDPVIVTLELDVIPIPPLKKTDPTAKNDPVVSEFIFENVVAQSSDDVVPEINDPVPTINSPDTSFNSPLILPTGIAHRFNMNKGEKILSKGGSLKSEDAVVRALKWLKKNQLQDGSWAASIQSEEMGSKMKTGLTGLALLTFLAHGETPGSDAYGEPVSKAIKYLLATQQEDGRFYSVPDRVNMTYKAGTYGQAIAVYALSEAYSMTRIHELRSAVEKGVAVILGGQQKGGAWYYAYQHEKQNTSVTGWHVQALKAAYMAGIQTPGIKEALDRSVVFLRHMHDRDSGLFHYTMPNQQPRKDTGITGSAVLALQLLNEDKTREAKKGVKALRDAECSWEQPVPWSLSAWYYITQAQFFAGGKQWAAWQNQFASNYVKHQHPDGHWSSPAVNSQVVEFGVEAPFGPCYSTALGALTLMVYYRNLPPSTQQAYDAVSTSSSDSDDDIEVEIL